MAASPCGPLALGFDLDHTLVRYKLPALYALIHRCLAAYLVDVAGYPLRDEFSQFDASFGAKGIVLDLETGDFLKLDVDGRICRARHGTRAASWLSAQTIAEKYGRGPWKHAASVSTGARGPFFPFTTYFDIPAAFLCGRLVDYCDDKAAAASSAGASASPGSDAGAGVPTVARYDFMFDVFKAFDHVFSPEALALNRGGYFSELRARTDHYVYSSSSGADASGDGNVSEWLKAQRRAGHLLFLVTNSQVNYSELLMKHAFGEDWRGLFDVVVFYASKKRSGRGFFCPAEAAHNFPFHESAPFAGDVMAADANALGSVVPDAAGLRWRAGAKGPGYIGGNCHVLGQLLVEKAAEIRASRGSPGPSADAGGDDKREDAAPGSMQILYFGDHILGDVLAASAYSSGGPCAWKPVAVIEEVRNMLWR
eukprot:g2534.t1